jgi:CHAD domain-containing protein
LTADTPQEQREREIKFEVPPGWSLPDPDELAPRGGSVSASHLELESKYFDTEAHDLLANGLTLRCRTGTADEGWHLKIPAGDARTEIRLPLGGSEPPDELLHMTFGLRRGLALGPIAILRTHRDAHLILDGKGNPLAELVVDDVTGERLGSSVTVSTWREVEVELKDGDEAFLDKASSWLRAAGAEPARSSSKLARTVGAVPAAPVLSHKTVVGAVRSYLAEQHHAIIAGDVALRRERDVIHGTRVATRRYRSALRVFAELFDEDRATALDEELKWYASALGEVRDRQVLRTHLFEDLDELPSELVLGPVATRLTQTFEKELAQAWSELDSTMRSARYLALLDELRVWAADPPVRADDEPATKLARYINKTERKYKKRLKVAESLDDSDPDKHEAMHGARKAAKRARYTAELSVPALGKKARKSVKKAKKLQSHLGDRQDAIVAAAFLRRLGATAGTTPDENGFTYGLLLGRELQRGGITHP